MGPDKGIVVESVSMKDGEIKEATGTGEVVNKTIEEAKTEGNVVDIADAKIVDAKDLAIDDEKMKQEQALTEEELKAKQEEFEKFQAEIQKAVEEKGIVYVHNGELLDRDSVQIYSDEYVIVNTNTRTPFIFDGQIIRYGNRIQAEASLMTLRMYTGNNDLMLINYKELAGKSIL